MDFESWTNPSSDRERLRRLAIGWVIGAASILTTGVVLAVNSGRAPEEIPEENVLAVQLAEQPEPEPEPEEEPEPEPEAVAPAPNVPRGPVLPKLSTPTEVPTDVPEENNATAESNPYGGTFDPYQYAGGQGASRGTAVVSIKTADTTPALKPKVQSGPLRVTAETNPPTELQKGPAAYPAEAKAAGIQGVVVVKFVVSVTGEPSDVQAVSGPPELRAACEEQVRGSRYSPATLKDSGQPVAVFKNKRCVYKLKI